MQRWYIDGTVECFTGGHAALAVFAILVLGLCAALIMGVAIIAMEKVKVRSYVATFFKIALLMIYCSLEIFRC